MSRSTFGPWGVELDADDFARALAALGVLSQAGWSDTENTLQGSALLLDEISRQPGGLLPWRHAVSPALWIKLPEAAILARAWRRFTESPPHPLRLQILARNFDPLWLVRTLSRPAVQASSIFFEVSPASAISPWQWPLRVGVVPTAEPQPLRTELEQAVREHSWLQPLVEWVDPGTEERSDLLLLPGTLRSGLAALLARRESPGAQAVLVVGEGEPLDRDTFPLLRLLQVQTGASAAGVGAAAAPERKAWFVRLIRELAHRQTFDLAFAEANREQRAPGAPLLANGAQLDSARLPNAALDLDLGRRSFPLEAVSRDASDERRRSFSVDTEPLLTAKAPRRDRLVQARVFLADGESPGEGAPEPPVGFFRAGAPHRIDVRIGERDETWISSTEPFPDRDLPPSKIGRRLTVVFSEPEIAADPRVEQIFLPPTGPSTTCSFFLEVPEGVVSVEARIVVLYRNRVLQTSLLQGPVTSSPQPRAAGITLAPEVVVSPGLFDLDQQLSFDAALVLNHTRQGAARALSVVNGSAEYISLDDLQKHVSQIDDKLNGCDWGGPDFQKLDSTGTVDLLRFLARHGALLYNGLVKSQFENPGLARAQRLQVVCARPEARLPIELIYDRPSPLETAPLCSGAAQALESGSCPGTCTAPGRENSVVCPLGFWGLNRVVEWHLYRPAAQRELRNSDFALQEEKIARRKQLDVLQGAIVAASERADKLVRGSVAKVEKAVVKATRRQGSAQSWEEWKSQVKALSPSLLVLIPHTARDRHGITTLEIGGTEPLPVDQIGEPHVLGPQSTSPPIVLLLGCAMGAPEISFEGAVSQLRLAHAAIVVTTSVEILGRQATRVAAEIVERLAASAGERRTFGDVLLQVRRAMLRDGFPVVLSLSAYGDADWRL